MSTESISTYQGEGANAAGTPDHIHEMLAKVETPIEVSDIGLSDEAPIAGVQERPEWLPDKFGSAQEMAQAYKSLEQKLSGSREEVEQYQMTEEQAQETQEIQEQSTSQVYQLLDERGLDFQTFQDEMNETGGLSDGAYEALEEVGIQRGMVNTWIDGQNAKAEQNIDQLYNLTGGTESYNRMLQWADDNLHPSEAEAFNKQIDNLDVTAELAVTGLFARYQQSEGAMPSLMSGDTNVSIEPRYDSLAQITSAMSDPRYETDPAYRAQVAGRLNNSSVL
jgi:anion-transporting  ArsA/GET3 family ATPase